MSGKMPKPINGDTEMSKNVQLAPGVVLSVDTDNGNTSAPTTIKHKGRQKGQKIETIVPASIFVPKYISLVNSGKSLDEIATEFKLGKMTILQKRAMANRRFKEAGRNVVLPLPKSETRRGAQKIDWAAMADKLNAAGA